MSRASGHGRARHARRWASTAGIGAAVIASATATATAGATATATAGAATVTPLSTAGIPASVQRSFRVLGRDPGPRVTSAQGSPPAQILTVLLRRDPSGQGASRASARLVRLSASARVLVLAGPHGICVATSEPQSPPRRGTTTYASCSPIRRVDRTGVAGSVRGAIAYGIVPNGNRSVSIATDRGPVIVPVIANVFYATGLHGDRGISFHHH